MTEKQSLISTRYDVMLWDCGCLTWTEGDRFMFLPCGQQGCRVASVVKEESLARNNRIVVVRLQECEE